MQKPHCFSCADSGLKSRRTKFPNHRPLLRFARRAIEDREREIAVTNRTIFEFLRLDYSPFLSRALNFAKPSAVCLRRNVLKNLGAIDSLFYRDTPRLAPQTEVTITRARARERKTSSSNCTSWRDRLSRVYQSSGDELFIV